MDGKSSKSTMKDSHSLVTASSLTTHSQSSPNLLSSIDDLRIQNTHHKKISDQDTNKSSTPIPTVSSILEYLENHKEWTSSIVLTCMEDLSHGTILVKTSSMVLNEEEITQIYHLYDKREDTIANGILINNEQFDVHRFHPPLIYGRRGDPLQEDGEGIAVWRGKRMNGNGYIYCLITYKYPTVSARAVPQLRTYGEETLVHFS